MVFDWRAAVLGVCSWWFTTASDVSAVRAACPRPRLAVEAELDSAWLLASHQLDAWLASQSEPQTCATVRLLGGPGAMSVRVELADGRSAVRQLESEQVLVATVEALLVPLPGVPRAEPTPSVPPASPETKAPAAALEAGSKVGNPRTLSLEFALGPSVRLAGSPRYLGYGLTAHVQVIIGTWLLGSWARWDIQDRPLGQEHLPPDLDMASFLLGAFAGRRLSLPTVALDAVIGPNVIVENQEAQSVVALGETGGAFGEVSVALGLRLVTRRSQWPRPNLFVLLGAELYPRRMGRTVRLDPELPALPAWGGTLAVGMSWSPL